VMTSCRIVVNIPNQPLQLTLRYAQGQASGSCDFLSVSWQTAGFGLSNVFGKLPPCSSENRTTELCSLASDRTRMEEKLDTYRMYVRQLIQQFGAELPSSEAVETQYIFDTEHDHYQLFQVGWEKYHEIPSRVHKNFYRT